MSFYTDELAKSLNHQNFWRLNDTTSTATDSEGSLNGTYNGTYTQSQTGAIYGDSDNACYFDGSSGYVEVADHANLTFAETDSFTIELWAKRNRTATVEWIFGKGDASYVRTNYSLDFAASDYPIFHISHSNGTWVGAVGSNTITDTNYHHYVCVHTGSATGGSLTIYVDGVVGSTATYTGSIDDADAQPFRIGGRRSTGGDFFQGTIDDVSIFNDALTASEVENHYNAGKYGYLIGTVSDTISSVDSLLGSESIMVLTAGPDSVGISDTLVDEVGYFLAETVGFVDTSSSTLVVVSSILEDNIELSDSLITVYEPVLTEVLALTDATPERYLDIILSLSDKIGIAPSAEAFYSYVKAVSVIISIADTMLRGFDDTITETLAIAESVQSVLEALLSDTIGISDSGTNHLVFYATNSETVDISESNDPSQVLLGLLEDGISFVGSLNIQDVTYLSVVTNIANRGVSEYNNFPFDSYGEFRNSYLASASDGIYLLEGDDDEGSNIQAQVETGMMDFNTTNYKTIPECYLGYTSDGDLVLKVYTNEQGNKKEVWYSLTRTKDTADTDRFVLSRGVKGRWFQFELVNRDGGDFEMESIEFFPVVLSRRIY